MEVAYTDGVHAAGEILYDAFAARIGEESDSIWAAKVLPGQTIRLQ